MTEEPPMGDEQATEGASGLPTANPVTGRAGSGPLESAQALYQALIDAVGPDRARELARTTVIDQGVADALLEVMIRRMPEADRPAWRRRFQPGTPEAEAWAATARTQATAYLAALRPDQAAEIRRLRVEEGASYRAVAAACYAAADAVARRRLWGEERPGFPWIQPNNQEIGMRLCAAAAARLGEDAERAPWT
jgi:hypothetical protein